MRLFPLVGYSIRGIMRGCVAEKWLLDLADLGQKAR